MTIPSIVYDLLRNKRFLVGLSLFIFVVCFSLIGSMIYARDPFDMSGPPEQPPSREYPLGTDRMGRDILAQIIWGTRYSLYVGVLTALIAMPIGIVIGAVAGVEGGIIDELLMSLTNIVLTIPSILLAILIAATLPSGLRTYEMVAFVIGITSWPWLARAVRAQMLSLREREFVYLSKMAGRGNARIAFEDLLPNIATYVFMAFVLFVNGGILGEAGLSLIGVGPTRGITLGVVLYWAATMEALRRELWWWFIPAGIMIVLSTASLMIITTAVDEVFNPRLRGK
jgi:ABC-type dipeptide/oligopeptide/nickel transport systems, permease components|uniref:ABC transporter permease n=1 Tax=Ignisphaera aggregans TaxID=334771 RepID=A0A7J3Z7A5_9CREN